MLSIGSRPRGVGEVMRIRDEAPPRASALLMISTVFPSATKRCCSAGR